MKVTGERNSWGAVILVDGQPLDPLPSLKLRSHSPTGLEYGYSGSGPAQLALALMLKAGVPEAVALNLYQEFKREVISRLPDEFAMDVTFRSDGQWFASIT